MDKHIVTHTRILQFLQVVAVDHKIVLFSEFKKIYYINLIWSIQYI